ncbi:unnamed protein product [Cunninghamella blakesleeana]
MKYKQERHEKYTFCHIFVYNGFFLSPLIGSEENTSLLHSNNQGAINYHTVNKQNNDLDQVVTYETTINPEIERKKDIQRKLNGANLLTVLFGLWVGVGLASLDSSIVATVYPQIGSEFHKSNDVIWVATSYMLSYSALQPLYGRISDAFGRKTTLQFAVFVFFVGSLLCGAANSLWSLVFARFVAGIGGGGLNTISSVITSDLVTLRERGTYQGYANIWFAVGGLVGAPLGGWLTDTIGWRYCFYINLPFLLISIYVSTWVLTNYNLEDKDQSQTTWDRVKEIDYIGAILIVSAVLAIMIATSLGGNSRPWSDPLVVSCLVAFFILIIAFLVVQKKWAKNPLMPWYVVTDRTSLACCFSNFFGVTCSFATTFIIPLYYQALLGYTPSEAGLMFLPKVIGGSLGSLYAGFHMKHTGDYKKFLIFSAILQLASMICYTLWDNNVNLYVMLPCLFADGFATGSILTAALVAMLSVVELKDMATMTSVSYLYRSTGAVIGISLSQAIFQGVVKSELIKKIRGPDAEHIIEIARKSMMEIRDLLPPEVLEPVLETYQHAIQYAFVFCLGIAILNVISTLFIKQYSLKK